MKSFLIAFLIAFNFCSYAQSFNISGSISNKGISTENFVTITLSDFKTQKLVKLATQSQDGIFEFANIPIGSYQLKISGLGFEEYVSAEIIVFDKNIMLESINIKTKQNQLAEVQVVVKKPIVEVFADKTVSNVQNTISAAGLTAMELLRKAPGVIVDNNDNLVVEGKTGVQI